jgi:hypothetical protein
VKIINGSKVRVNVNLRLRRKPSTTADTICTVQAGVQVTALGPPANGWLWAHVIGKEHEDYPNTLFSESHAESSIQAKRGVAEWKEKTHTGYLSMGNPSWLTVEDGPE